MARHVVKITFLLITGLITTGLLTFMLVSDGWIGINRQKLNVVEKKFETQFQIYSGQKANEDPNEEQIKSTTQTSFISANTKINKLTRSTSTTTTTTTTKTTSTVTVSTKTIAKASTKINDHDLDNNDNHETDQDVEENDETETGNHDDENLDYEQEDTSNNNKRLKRSSDNEVVDYVYLTKLWPFVKYKSLYSECIEYKKLNLKISSSFLNQPNKELLIGTINYGKLLDKRANESLLVCDAKAGMIKCLLTQTCVHGKL
jgi:hypothetical protein